MDTVVFFLAMSMVTLSVVEGREHENGDIASNRKEKVISLFNIVSFENNICIASATRNGTCFTAGECSAQGGSASGTCASGYGVCCVFVIGCGSMSSANCTYIEQSSFTSAASLSSNPCTYTFCRANSQICRLRLDFTMNILAPPVTGMQQGTGALSTGGALGDCVTDSMTLSSPGGTGSPTICGFNTGQHMIVDMSDVGCNMLTFNLGAGSTVSRQWSIKATQFVCNDDDGNGGPPGCLQYFTEATGVIASYNFNTAAATVSTNDAHLSNQQYNICFRRVSGNCVICYDLRQTNSFGLSISGAAIATALTGTSCSTDYVVIPGGNNIAAANTAQVISGISRFCGRVFNSATSGIAAASICTPVVPFVLGVNFDADEADASGDATMNELSLVPGGTTGFWLNYVQKSC